LSLKGEGRLIDRTAQYGALLLYQTW